ncbi:MAG TPA: hypothetical protein VHS13_09860 [Edaphobacter sp.]|jgi:hypothetical protein|nr:hypothetical protein [Edaphobacter sp.]
MRIAAFTTALILALPVSVLAQGTPDDQISPGSILNAHHFTDTSKTANLGGGVLGNRSNGSVLGLDTIPNWSSYFYEPGLDSFGNLQFTWEYTMVGHSPLQSSDGSDDNFSGKTTKIGAPLIAVNVDLRNADGSPRFVNGVRLFQDATKFVAPVLSSPIFSKTSFSSSNDPTQFADAVSRAEFFHKTSDDWHTLLKPRVGTTRTMVLLRGTYQFALNADGSCCAFILVDQNAFAGALFPPTATDTSTVMGAAENAGDIRTRDISSFLFNNVFLFSGTPSNCCVIGFHSYDVEPGDASNQWKERRYVMDYASWVSPGLFSDPTFSDVVALSHEMAETFNDPFVNNATPWYRAPNGLCQNNLETGDAIEGLPNAQFAISLNGTNWHVQNEALLQWFAGVSPSSAINGAYSYPDATVLTSPPAPTTVNCK